MRIPMASAIAVTSSAANGITPDDVTDAMVAPREAPEPGAAGVGAEADARAIQVLALLQRGLTNGELAGRLFISPKTAGHHVSAILTKLGVGSRREAAEAARRLGLSTAARR